MKKSIKYGVIAAVVTLVLEVLFAYFFAYNYFFGGIATSHFRELLVAVKFFLPTCIALDWILHMAFTLSERKNAERQFSLLMQYVIAALVLIAGINALKNRYMYYGGAEAFENSHLFLLYSAILIVTVLPITDFRKWSATWRMNQEWMVPVWNHLCTWIRKLSHVFYRVWNGLIRRKQLVSAFLIAVGTVGISFIVMETYSTNLFYEIPCNHIVWNLVLYSILYFIIWTLLRNVKWSSIVMLGLVVLVGIINYFVIRFRVNPIFLGDITVVGTALSVAGGFKYSVDAYFIIATLLAIFLLQFLVRIHMEQPKRKRFRFQYWAQMIISYAIILALGFTAVKSDFLYQKIDRIGWNLLLQSKQNGFLLSFVADSVKSIIDEPEGYDLEELSEVMESITADVSMEDLNLGIDTDCFSEKEEFDSDMTEPNIIVVMNESFSDLSVLGELETDVDYMSYVKSLTEDTIYGTLHVSPYGGNTVYSEFEFLTGNTMAFLPYGCIPYTQYLNTHEEIPSLVSTLEQQETPYTTIALHPYEKTGYNRVDVYDSFGFDQFVTEDDFTDYVIHRKYIQDEDDYQKIIELFEEKEENQPLFVFNVTMQNHGGYGESSDYDFDEPVHVTNYEYDMAVDEYLSSIKEADTAVKTLIDYFQSVDEPTIILFFGDHQPALTGSFYDAIFGKDSSELTQEETLLKYEVPFFIWSNYTDYGGQYMEQISTNYLSSVLMELAGLQATDYQKFLLKVHEEYPVISAVGMMNQSGDWIYEDASEAVSELEDKKADLLQIYEMLQYNYIFDEENRCDSYFYPRE